MIKYENHEFTFDSEEPDSLLMFFKINKIAYSQFSIIVYQFQQSKVLSNLVI